MDRFVAISTFAKVVEVGSFVGAANRLGVSVSAVSRQVTELEAHLDARLLNRTTRRLSLTESGRAFYERCVQLLADLEEAEQSANAATIAPRGTLRVTCGTTFGTRYLAPAIADFVSRYPRVRFDIDLSDHASDLVDEGFDAAVRIGRIGSLNLVGRKIGETRLVCCAAPSYLARHGTPKKPADLAAHACLTYEYSPSKNVWPFHDRQGQDRSVKVDGPVHANSGQFLEAVAAAGLAIVCEPDFIVRSNVRAGALVPILRAYPLPPSDIQVVYPSRRHLSAKVRAFTEFLMERFAQPDWSLVDARSSGRRKALR